MFTVNMQSISNKDLNKAHEMYEFEKRWFDDNTIDDDSHANLIWDMAEDVIAALRAGNTKTLAFSVAELAAFADILVRRHVEDGDT